MFFPFEVENDADHEYQQTVPVAVYALLAAMLAVHLWLTFGVPDDLHREDVLFRFGVVARDLHGWSFLSCTFLHGGWLHLLGNAYFLWIYGAQIERLLGTLRFVALYVAGALVSVGLHCLTLPAYQADVPTVGASGAVSAVLGACFVLMPWAKLRCLLFTPVSFRPAVVQVPAWLVLCLWFVGQLIYSLRLIGNVEEVAFWAHVGGFAAGAVAGTLLYGVKHRQQAAAEAESRRPLVSAWQAVCAGDLSGVAEFAECSTPGAASDLRGTEMLLGGVIAARLHGDAAAARRKFTLALTQARDYGDRAKALTAYLQMLHLRDGTALPATLHRDAGFAAAALKQRALAVAAFDAALAGGLAEGREQVMVSLERLQTTLRNTNGESEGP